MWQLVGTTVLCTQKEDCLLCQVNSGGNEVLLNIFLVALLVSFPLLCLRHVACILQLLPKMQGFMAKHKLVSDRMAHYAAVGRADLACARMKTHGRQLALLLDLRTQRHRSAPTKAIGSRSFAAIKWTRTGQECTKRPRSKRPRDAHTTHLCGSSAISRCDSGPCHCVNMRGRFWSPLSREHGCRRRRGRGSTSCDRAPARAGRIWVLNGWHRLHGKKRRTAQIRARAHEDGDSG